MPEPFKNLLNADRVRLIAADFQRAWPAFPAKPFIADATKGLEQLELKARASHIAAALTKHLPSDPTRALRIAIDSMGAPLEKTQDNGGDVFHYFPVATWLHDLGPSDVETALEANYELTKRFTAEFSIRSLLTHAQGRTLKELARWVSDENAHVRRLISEGTRPRLPWAGRLPAIQADPSLVLPLLERLKDDPSEYVRRSVANHLNDVAKDHPKHVLAVAKRWLVKASPERQKVVEHGLRTLLKAGNAEALALLGASGEDLKLKGSVSPRSLRIGEAITIEATVKNHGDALTHVVIEGVVHFKSKTGSSKKKFRLARVDLEPGAQRTVSRRFTMAHRSIRRLFPGPQRVEIQANGRLADAGGFVLLDDSARSTQSRGRSARRVTQTT